jgi:hypothetical protein
MTIAELAEADEDVLLKGLRKRGDAQAQRENAKELRALAGRIVALTRAWKGEA